MSSRGRLQCTAGAMDEDVAAAANRLADTLNPSEDHTRYVGVGRKNGEWSIIVGIGWRTPTPRLPKVWEGYPVIFCRSERLYLPIVN